MNLLFIMNCLFYGFRHNFSYIKYETRSLLFHRPSTTFLCSGSMHELPENFTKKRLFKPFSDKIHRRGKQYDGTDGRNITNVVGSEATSGVRLAPDSSMAHKNIDSKIQENTRKYDLLQKLQSNAISQIDKLQMIKTHSEIFENPSSYKLNLLRSLQEGEFTEFYIHDI